MRHSGNRTEWIGAGLLVTWLFVFSICHADQQADSAPSLKINHSILSTSVFRQRAQQRLYTAAQSHINSREYAAAFDVLQQLLKQPFDSGHLVSHSGPAHGVQSATVRLLLELPFSARRDWNQFCTGPGTLALSEALHSRSRVALNQVAANFPCSSVAADALITETIWATTAQEKMAARIALQQLEDWQAAGILTAGQTRTVRGLQEALRHSAGTKKNAPKSPTDASVGSSVRSASAWFWKDNVWKHRQGPDELPRRGIGNHFSHRFGCQHPLLSAEYVITRTPAGIASLDRTSGINQWFLNCRSVVRNRNEKRQGALGPLFDIIPIADQRLEASDGIVYFVDGQPFVPFQPPHAHQQRLILRQGATHLVALRTGENPFILWQVGGTPATDANVNALLPDAPRDFEYSFELPSGRIPASKTTSHPVADDRLDGHLFLSAPKVADGRLYVTTHCDDTIWLNSLSATQGSLLWQQPLTWQEPESDDPQHNSAIVGGISDDIIVCLFANGIVAGCNPIDGRIQWLQTIVLQDEHDAETGEFGLADNRLIPQTAPGQEFGSLWMQISAEGIICGRRGSRAISCLNPATGAIRWSTTRDVHGSTADQQYDMACIGLIDDQLITIGYGHCRAIDVSDGSQTWVRPLGNHDGRVCCDDRSVYVALNSGRLLTIDGHDGSISYSQQLQLGQSGPALASDQIGLVEASAWSVRSWWWQDKSTTVMNAADIENALNDLALYRLHTSLPYLPVPRRTLQECLSQVAEADLSAEQHLKFALLAPKMPDHDSLLIQQLNEDPNRPIRILPGWTLPIGTAARMLQVNASSLRSPLTTDASVLYPANLGSLYDQLDAAVQLQTAGKQQQAELLLLNMDIDASSDLSDKHNELLRKVRGGALAPGFASTSEVGPVETTFTIKSSSNAGFRLADIAANFQRYRSRMPVAMVPSWNRSLFMNVAGASPHVGLVDIGQGIETAWTPRSSLQFPTNISHQDAWLTPGLVLVSRANKIGVISAFGDSPLTPLWLRAISKNAAGQVLALSSRQLVVSTNEQLQSLHPLTGELQWSHNWKQSREWQHMEGQFWKVYCSPNHVILLSSLGTGYVVLRAIDGAIVYEGSRRTGQVSQVIDEYLVTKNNDNRLEVTHLITGKSVDVAGNDHDIVAIYPAQQLGQNKAMVITKTPGLMILDLESGQAYTEIVVVGELGDLRNGWLSPRLVHRSGLIYVALSVRNWRMAYVPEAVFNEAVTGSGVLICIDPHTGREMWQRKQHATVVAPVFGDPCPFLVLWTTRYTNGGTRIRSRSDRLKTALEITVLDAHTGELVGQTERHLAVRPLQIVHDRTTQQLRFTTEHSTIEMDYAN